MADELDAAALRATYQERVKNLVDRFAEWIRDVPNVFVEEKEAELHEDLLGRYKVVRLIALRNDSLLLELKPIGAIVVAAKGRVDVKGPIDLAAAIYLEGPPVTRIVTKDERGNVISESSQPVFGGVDKEGWYWIDSQRSQVTFLDKPGFLKLLATVSDYHAGQ